MPVSPNTENYMYGKGELFFKPDGATGYMHLGNCPAFSISVELEKAEHYSSMAGTREKDLSKVTQKTASSSITLEEFSVQNMNLVLMGGTPSTSSQTSSTLDGVEVTTVADQYVPIQEGTMRLSNVVVEDDPTSPTTQYEEGVDYLVNRESGMIMALSTGSISGTCYVSADAAALDISTVNALAESSTSGELYFVGNPDIGPNWQVRGWKVELSLSGELPFISEDIAQLSVDAEFQADRNNHPAAPFFEAVNLSAGA